MARRRRVLGGLKARARARVVQAYENAAVRKHDAELLAKLAANLPKPISRVAVVGAGLMGTGSLAACARRVDFLRHSRLRCAVQALRKSRRKPDSR